MIAAYFAPPWGMLKRIARVGAKGRARLVTAAKSDNTATIGAARFTYNQLLKRGVEIYEYQRTKLHTKLMVFDDVVHIGSANFDIRSLYLNLEMMLRVDDAEFASLMRALFRGRDRRQPARSRPKPGTSAATLLQPAEMGLVVLPGDGGRLYRHAAPQLRR